jgi:hypothetical protein
MAVALAVLAVSSGASGESSDVLLLREAAQGTIHPAQLTTQVTQRGQAKTVTKNLPFLSAGIVQTAADDLREEAADATAPSDLIGMAPDSNGCSARNLGQNVRVNQDCTFRRQAEEDIAANPTDPSNLVAGQNDSRIGFNHCGIDWSIDNGVHWGDLLPPFWQRLNAPAAPHTVFGGIGTGHTYDAASDPTVAFDADGNAYFSCVLFDINDNASAILVTQSPAVAKGSFFFNVPSSGSNFVVTEDNQQGPGHTATAAHDKEFIAADFYPSSPNKNNVYVTWTTFEFANQCGQPHPSGGYCEAPIFGSMSTNGGRTWSPPEEISGASPLCRFGNAFNKQLNPNACNFDQGADPTALPNGDLVVAFNNGNTPGLVNQQLAVVCHPTGSTATSPMTAKLNCGDPTKVGDDVIAGEPQCDFGRGPEECIPGPFIRTNDFPRISTNAQNGHVYVTWQDYRNGEYDIQMSMSSDGGHTWSPEKTVNRDSGLDHYMPAVDQSPTVGDRVGVSYYRSARVPNESAAGPSFTGGGIFAPCGSGGAIPTGASSCAGVAAEDSDYALAGGTGTALPYPYVVVSPVFPPPDGNQVGFNGDYSGLVISTGTEAHPVWSDTRNSAVAGNGVAHDEDIFSDAVALPSGTATPTTGTIGH